MRHTLPIDIPGRPALAALIVALLLLIAPALKGGAAAVASLPREPAPTARLDCGYDPRGADDEVYSHKLNALRRAKDASAHAASFAPEGLSARARVEDVNNVSVIEDNGQIIIQPSKFDLKNRSIIFTPEDGGYRVGRADLKLITDYGFRIGYFYGPDNHYISTANNGWRDIILHIPFPFFGTSYDTLYVGTNGYITFTAGDTNARASAAALATDLPRVAPLWADLDATDEGAIYFNRVEGGHLITWDGVGQTTYSGKSTFQALLYDDGRIAFIYKNVKARSSLIGISPGGSESEAQPVDFSDPPVGVIAGPIFESFSKQKRLDLPALLGAFYAGHEDVFDSVYVWTDFSFDNGLGVAHSFNVRNDVSGIGLRVYDKGAAYASPQKLSTIITMGNQSDWPSDPQDHGAGLNSAISIVCHEQGHRWLAYVLFDAEHDIKDDFLGRDNSHWSFLMDTRTASDGSFSSLMEGNAWRDAGNGTVVTTETAVNYFSDLDQYLMGLLAPEEVGEITYFVTDEQLKQALREKSPVSGFAMTATRKTARVSQIIEREGPRVPDSRSAPKEFRIAFILLTEQGAAPAAATVNKMARYRDALVRYFSVATGRRGSLSASLN